NGKILQYGRNSGRLIFLTIFCEYGQNRPNKPFKDNLYKEWHFWMASGGVGQTTSNLRHAKLGDVYVWVNLALALDSLEDEEL
ncbi:2181_t:CDS:2, partial [Ambispora gerdemannii]